MLPEKILDGLILDEGGSIVLLVMDGLGDTATAANNWRTPLEAAKTPNLDALVKESACGRGVPVSPGITPGSGPGHLALFGYDPVEHEIGRGVLEAAGLDMEITPRDVCARANFATYDAKGIITDRRAGRIPTAKCEALTAKLAKEISSIEDVEIVLKAGKGHRFVAILRGDGLDGDLTDADPHHEGSPILEVKPSSSKGKKAARIANEFIKRANEEGLTEKVYILAGVTPMKSVGMAKYMKNKVPGMDVPDEIIKRLQGAEKGKVAAEGIKMACEQIEEFKEMDGVHGVHLMAIEWEHKVPEIAEQAKVLPRPQVD